MPERTAYAPGTPSWVDLGTTDVAAAKDFYAAVLGWGYEDVSAGEWGTYTSALRDGRPVAGLFPQPEQQAQMGAPSAWSTYISVDDADAVAASAAAAGATTLMEPTDVMDAGRMAVLQDPTGAVFGLWQPRAHQGAALVNEPGALTWNELVTGDRAAAAVFYTDVLGWAASETTMPDGQSLTMFLLGDAPVASARDLPAADVPPHWLAYFAVEDADVAAAAVAAGGGTVVMPPFDAPPGQIAVAIDPTGAGFAVIALNPDFQP